MTIRLLPAALALTLAVPSLAPAATWYVANTGADNGGCGVTTATACRSIQQAIELANAGDIVSVGPGRYGDLNRNGIPGDAGEERGSPGCGCVLSINKAVAVISTAGAAATVIDARTVRYQTNVLLITVGGDSVVPGKGSRSPAPLSRMEVASSWTRAASWCGAIRSSTQPRHICPRTGPDISRSSGWGNQDGQQRTVLLQGNYVDGWFYGVEI